MPAEHQEEDATMKNVKVFKDCDEFLRAALKFSGNLTQCIGCRQVWISTYDIGRTNGSGPDDLLALEMCVEEMNGMHLCPSDLGDLGIFVSHGLCKLCLRKSLLPTAKKNQRREGNPDCFATAENGYCDQTRCKYQTICVTDANELRLWRERIEAAC